MIGKWCIFCRSHKLCTHNKSNHKVGFPFFLYTPCTYTPLESLLQLFCVSQTFLLFQCCLLKLESRVNTQHILNFKTIGMITEKEFPLFLFFFLLKHICYCFPQKHLGLSRGITILQFLLHLFRLTYKHTHK